jgi:hypothetical protein
MNLDAPIVFLGPTCPADDVLSILPEAMVVPPVQRGDLYRYRILKHSLFVIIDGVFGNAPAISPREVIDVLADGVTVIGASSMGAIRAADCAPAGAIGIGEIYRLYKRRILSSEDEVAVVYRADQPFPPLSEPLINMRVALHRATRAGLLPSTDAALIISAARATHYSERTWQSAFATAGIRFSDAIADYVRTVDVKRTDARVAFRWAARPLHCGPRQAQSHAAPILSRVSGRWRERAPDPLDGKAGAAILHDLVIWLATSGHMYKMQLPNPRKLIRLANTPEGDGMPLDLYDFSSFWQSADSEAAVMRFTIHQRGEVEARGLDLTIGARELRLAELEISDAHSTSSWDELMDCHRPFSEFCRRLAYYRTALAMTKRLKQTLFSTVDPAQQRHDKAPQWRRP